MANGMTRKDIRDLLRNQDFLDQNLDRFGGDTLSFGPAGVVGAGKSLLNLGSKAMPWVRRNVIDPIREIPTAGKVAFGTGAAAAGALLSDEEQAAVEAGAPPVSAVVGGGTPPGAVVAPPKDTWTPGGLPTALDFLSSRRRNYIESISGALGQAAILNLMEKGAGDKFLKQIEGDIEQQEEFKDDEYVAKINKAIFSKPYKNSKEIFNRLVKAQVPIGVASKITGYVPKGEMVTFINPTTEETYAAPKDTTPRAGFRRVDPTLDKKVSARSDAFERSKARAVGLLSAGQEADAVRELAGHLVRHKSAGMIGYEYSQAEKDARKILGLSEEGGSTQGAESPDRKNIGSID